MGKVFIELGARMGYAARGVVFIIISAFAFLAALGSRNHTVGTKGALEALLTQPFGRVLLWLVAAGLLFFGIWRVIQAVFDTDNCGRDNKGLLRRLGMLGGAVVNLALGGLIGKLLGHTQVQTMARYSHLAADPVLAAADQVSKSLADCLAPRRTVTQHRLSVDSVASPTTTAL